MDRFFSQELDYLGEFSDFKVLRQTDDVTDDNPVEITPKQDIAKEKTIEAAVHSFQNSCSQKFCNIHRKKSLCQSLQPF